MFDRRRKGQHEVAVSDPRRVVTTGVAEDGSYAWAEVQNRFHYGQKFGVTDAEWHKQNWKILKKTRSAKDVCGVCGERYKP